MSDAISPAVVSKYTVGVTGATGYVGGRLVPALLEAGYGVRCLVREPRKLDARPWRHHPHVEVIAVDLVDSAAVALCPLSWRRDTAFAVSRGSPGNSTPDRGGTTRTSR
jgi:nucleoside-diphosphate-sugar epimerase